MQRLLAFNHISLDGYFTDARGDMSWAHEGADEEFNAFTSENANGEGTMLFGRVTYAMMAGFWPTPMAQERMPDVARRMNSAPKVVFSKTLRETTWSNTRLVKTDPVAEVRSLKQAEGPGMVIFGSGRLITALADAGLIDEYQLIVNPVALGAGRTMFEGLRERLTLNLVTSRAFKNGKVLLCYVPSS